jgi:antitoxin component of MazEF toxin-antitoxin module
MLIYRRNVKMIRMQKNSEKNFTIIEIDPITNNYFIKLPEWVISELGWYEDTEIQIELEGNEIILAENRSQ